MANRIVFGILSLLIICSCAQQKSKKGIQNRNDVNQAHYKMPLLKIENGQNQGIRASTALGIKNPVIYTTSILTNEDTIPIHLKLALSMEYEFPNICRDSSTFKVFLFPEKLTPDTATLTNRIVSSEDNFLKSPLAQPTTYNKTLKPDEFCVITLGTSYSGSSNCEVIPRAIFSNFNREIYGNCDRLINEVISTSPHLEIGVKLEFYNQRKFIPPEDHCSIVPCGQISLQTNR